MRGVFLDTDTMKPDELDFSGLEGSLPEWRLYRQSDPGEVGQRIADAEVVVTNKVVLDRKLLSGAPRLKLVCVCATGMNNVDLDTAAELNISVRNVTDYAAASVAQHTLALMLGLATNWHRYRDDVAAGEWTRSPMFCLMHRPVVELAGKTLGIVGYGVLGRAVAKLGEAFAMRVRIAESLRPGVATDEHRVPLEELLAEADVISLHCPLNDGTRHLISREALTVMKPGAFLINTARGGLVDEQALADALRNGEIAGAALDVLSREPPPADHVLLADNIPNLILTPHNAWVSRECRQRLLDGVVANIENWKATS